MSWWFTLRRYSLPILLFSLCLSAVLLFAGKATSTQPFVAEPPSLHSAVTLGLQEDTPSTTPAVQTPLSLTENVQKTVLENGLIVLTKEVHTAPVVSVQVWYRIGSRNEAPGVNGIAHQLEHMLFKGTTSRPIQFGRLFTALGSDSNAFTSYDETAYFGTAERGKLRGLLELEADRMQNSLISADQLMSEKRVVVSELQGYENSPSYRLNRAVMRAAFPQHAYGLPVGGTKADVEKFTVEQVREYYRRYYSPNNATLVIVGDFQTEPTLKAVAETFGKVPKSDTTPKFSRSSEQPPSFISPTPARSPIILRQPGSTALLTQLYPLPAINHPDFPALGVMDYILTGGRSSRLYQALVESGLASDVSGYANGLIEGGWYDLSATAVPNQELKKIDQVFQETLADLQERGITEVELNRAKAQLRADTILGHRDITSQAFQLGGDQTEAGDYRYTDRYLEAVRQVSTADIQRVAQKYLDPKQRTVGFFEPTISTGEPQASTGNSSQTNESFNQGPPIDPAEVSQYLPAVESASTSVTQSPPERVQLANGLRVLLLKDSSTPTVTLTGHIRAGTEFDPGNKAGLAQLTADNLMNGTATKDALTLAKEIESRGSSLDFSASREGVSISGYTLATELPTVIQTLADVVQHATFPTDELERSRQRSLTTLKQLLDSPGFLAYRTLQQTIYPEKHPFHIYSTEETLKQITRTDVVEFYQKHYRPDMTVLTLVGDFDPAEVRSLLESQLGSWQANSTPVNIDFPPVNLPETVVRLNPVIPGKTQSITFIGYQGITRKDPRYYSALILNQILGGDTLSSRLGMEIRDREGLTYGIYSYFNAGRHAGPFYINLQTSPEDAQPAITRTLSLLKQLREQGVTVAEVAAAKASLISSNTVSLANPDELADRILMNEVYGLDESEIQKFAQKIESVNPEQVNQAAKELLHPDNLVVVTAGPAISAVQ